MPPGIGDSFWKPPLLGSMLNLGRVIKGYKRILFGSWSLNVANIDSLTLSLRL